jgi:N-acetylmuramoyl-L-alanine amidase
MITYPPNKHKTDSKTIFFIGSAKNSCKINSQEVALYPNGNFSSIVKLKLGENKIKVEIDGHKEERIVIGVKSKYFKPVLYAKHYEAFPPEQSSKENILRSIIVYNNRIEIPLSVAPVYNLEHFGKYKCVLDLAEINMNLDCVHYVDSKGPIIIGEVINAKFPIIFKRPVSNIEEKWENDSLVLDISYYDRDFKVCLDPGHGGEQQGTISPKGLTEKNLNLAVANLLQTELINLGVDCVMTRNSDIDVSLSERVTICNKENAQLFLSIHHNALPDGRDPTSERGVSCHYFHEQSKAFAGYLLDKLINFTDLTCAGLYRQDLHVLRENLDCISVLVELGFLIHPEESEIITRTDFQALAARVIAKAIYNFNNLQND